MPNRSLFMCSQVSWREVVWKGCGNDTLCVFISTSERMQSMEQDISNSSDAGFLLHMVGEWEVHVVAYLYARSSKKREQDVLLCGGSVFRCVFSCSYIWDLDIIEGISTFLLDFSRMIP